jgi:hypothetical protein
VIAGHDRLFPQASAFIESWSGGVGKCSWRQQAHISWGVAGSKALNLSKIFLGLAHAHPLYALQVNFSVTRI